MVQLVQREGLTKSSVLVSHPTTPSLILSNTGKVSWYNSWYCCDFLWFSLLNSEQKRIDKVDGTHLLLRIVMTIIRKCLIVHPLITIYRQIQATGKNVEHEIFWRRTYWFITFSESYKPSKESFTIYNDYAHFKKSLLVMLFLTLFQPILMLIGYFKMADGFKRFWGSRTRTHDTSPLLTAFGTRQPLSLDPVVTSVFYFFDFLSSFFRKDLFRCLLWWPNLLFSG